MTRILRVFLSGIVVLVALAEGSPALRAQVFQSLYQFQAASNPTGTLVQAGDGSFYGTASRGGNVGYGAVFRKSPGGTSSTLVNFNGFNGAYPTGGLVQGRDGNFYGTTSAGGSSYQSGQNDGYGTIFRVNRDGTITTLVNFNGNNGASPNGALLVGADGNFYGTTTQPGTIFQMTPEGVLTTLNGTDAAWPNGGLIQGHDGNFYGTSQVGGDNNYGAVFKVAPDGTFTTLASFNGSNGATPLAGLTLGSDGNFYGTTSAGGINFQVDGGYNGSNAGYGTVFRVSPTGSLTTLLEFDTANGANPVSGLVQGADGSFYGTAQYGGNGGGGYMVYDPGYGTVFRITPEGALTTLVNFDSANGANPAGILLQSSDGNFYGTTSGGTSGDGTLFQINPDGSFATIADFSSTNEAAPTGALARQ